MYKQITDCKLTKKISKQKVRAKVTCTPHFINTLLFAAVSLTHLINNMHNIDASYPCSTHDSYGVTKHYKIRHALPVNNMNLKSFLHVLT